MKLTHIVGTVATALILAFCYDAKPAIMLNTNVASIDGSSRGKPRFGYDGKLYGSTTDHGPAFGTIFRVDPVTGTYETLHSLNGTTDGEFSNGKLYGTGAVFYGTSGGGGSAGFGTVFSIDTNSVFQKLFDFPGGTNAWGALCEPIVVNNVIIGMTSRGGKYDNGMAYGVSNSVLIKSASMNATTNGYGSGNRPTLAPDGFVYFTCGSGGKYGAGTIVRMDPLTFALTNVYNFTNGPDGGGPTSALIIGKDGNLYGTTSESNSFGEGTVFRFNTSDLSVTTLTQVQEKTEIFMEELENGPDGDLGLYGTYWSTSTNSPLPPGTAFRVTYDGNFAEALDIHALGTGQKAPGSLALDPQDNCFYFATRYNLQRLMRLSLPIMPWPKTITSLSCDSNVVTWTSVAGQTNVVRSTSTLGDGLTNRVTVAITSGITSYTDTGVTNAVRLYFLEADSNGVPPDYWANIQHGVLQPQPLWTIMPCPNYSWTNIGGTNTSTNGINPPGL